MTHIEMDSTTLIAECGVVLTQIKRSRRKLWREKIQKHRKPHWLTRRKPTLKQAISRATYPGVCGLNERDMVQVRHGKQEAVVMTLLKMAKSSPTVTLSREDYFYLY